MARRRMVTIRFGIPKGGDEDKIVEAIRKTSDRLGVTARVERKKPLGVESRDEQIMALLVSLGDSDNPHGEYDRTQVGMAMKLDLHQSVVSRYLADLERRRLVRFKTIVIMGHGRRQRAYYVTPEGERWIESVKGT